VRILNPALELRSKLLSTLMGGDPAPTPFSTMRLPLDPTREPRSSITPRFADLLDYACKGMAGGFSLGSVICGTAGAGPAWACPTRGSPHTPPLADVNGVVCARQLIGRRDSRSGSGLRFYAQGLAISEPLRLEASANGMIAIRRFDFPGAESGK
jgi:hypothetical protein